MTAHGLTPALSTRSLTRRGLLAGGAATALALAGCSSGGNTTSGGNNGAAAGPATLPDHIPFTGTTPEFPAGPDGIPAGYSSLPADLVSTGRTPLPETAALTALIQGNPPAAGMGKGNSYYELIRGDIGADLKFSTAPWAQYTDKLQVTIASSDLPEVVQIVEVPQLATLLEKEFVELSEYLGGDKVAGYPSLAAVSPSVWKTCTLNGGLWGVTLARPSPSGITMLTRGDLMAKYGLDPAPELADGEDFLALLDELTDADKGHFAIGSDPQNWLMPILAEMYGAPNGWRKQGDTLVHAWETEEFTAALEQATKIWQAGYLHPNSFSDPGSNKVWWDAGTTTIYIDGVPGWGSHTRANPEYNVQGLVTPKWDGGGNAVKHLAAGGYPAYAAISKQASPDRVREILRMMDYVASPFGTTEWMHVNYGVEGKHYTMEDGQPVKTDLGDQEFFSLGYLGGQVSAQLFIPGDRDTVQRQHEYLTAVLPGGEADASDGLYSETAGGRGATENRKALDTHREVMRGNKSVADWTAAVDRWRTSVGDKIRDEYLAAMG